MVNLMDYSLGSPFSYTEYEYLNKHYVNGMLPRPSGQDDTVAIQNAIANKIAEGATIIYGVPGATYRIDGGISIDIGKIAFNGQGCKFVSNAGNVAITLTNTATDSYENVARGGIGNFELIGPGKAIAGSAGIYIGSASGSVAFASLHNVSIHRYAIGLKFGSNSWANKLHSVNAHDCGTCIDNATATAVAGEANAFYGCSFFNSDTAVRITAPGGYFFYGCSFDYCASMITANASVANIDLFGCHVEYNANANPVFTVGAASSLNMTGGAIVQMNPASSSYVVSNTGRAVFQSVSLQGVATTTNKFCADSEEYTYLKDSVLPGALKGPSNHVINTKGVSPSIVAGWASGTTPPNPTLLAGSTDTSGCAKWGTGTATSAATQFQVNYATLYNTPPVVVLTPGNAATAALGPFYIITNDGAEFGVGCSVAPPASQPANTYVMYYHVLG